MPHVAAGSARGTRRERVAQRGRAAEPTGRAVAALTCIVLDECVLHRAQHVAACEPLDGRDPRAFLHRREPRSSRRARMLMRAASASTGKFRHPWMRLSAKAFGQV
jgi:hypothetical protein